jgi:hypothetical protein
MVQASPDTPDRRAARLEATMAVWDPFQVLWLPHDTTLSSWQVLRAYLRRMDIMYRTVPDRDSWPGEAERIRRAAWALRTPAQRRQVLGDLAAQPSLLAGLGFDPGRAALAGALLTPLSGEAGLDEACDRRALEREAARMRLECRAAGQRPWPPAVNRG